MDCMLALYNQNISGKLRSIEAKTLEFNHPLPTRPTINIAVWKRWFSTRRYTEGEMARKHQDGYGRDKISFFCALFLSLLTDIHPKNKHCLTTYSAVATPSRGTHRRIHYPSWPS